jgi:hypothetical protein
LNFCHYCLNDEKLSDYLDYFESRNIGIINASLLSMGLLSQWGCPGLVSSSQSIGRGLSKVSATLFIQELSDRKAGYLVCCPQSTYCYYPVQLSQSGKRIEKYSLCRKAH